MRNIIPTFTTFPSPAQMTNQEKNTNNNKSKSTRFFKVAFFLCLFITLCYSFVWVVLVNLVDPKIHHFENYQRLENWDNPSHGRGDFDTDGRQDLITFTGCAFLSSVQESQIPKENQCIASGMAMMVFPGEDKKIGQKYIDVEDYELGARDDVLKKSTITHSYLGKNTKENWLIFVNSRDDGLKMYTINKSGLLEQESNVSLDYKIDEVLYTLSGLFVFLALPLVPISTLFHFLFAPFRPETNQIPLFEIVAFSSVTVLLFILWRRSKS